MSAVFPGEQFPGEDRLIVGKITGAFGIKGWVKVYSFTEPLENILSYRPWLVNVQGQVREMKVLEGRQQGPGIVARLEGVDDRNQAELLTHSEIAVLKNQLPAAEEGAVYWKDLEGLAVVNAEGLSLGTVTHLFETGANDVLVVKVGETERLIPFVEAYIREVDVPGGRVTVDWQLDW